jgi:hypothetical protein
VISSMQSIRFDLGLICRYDRAGPRYISYPTAMQFHEGFGEAEYRVAAVRSAAETCAAFRISVGKGHRTE